MSVPYPLNQITPPDPEARGDRPPLPPRYSDGQLLSFSQPSMSEIVPNWGMPSNFEIPLWDNLNNNPMCTPAFNDTRRCLPSARSNVDFRTGISTEMVVCRQFQRRGACSYGDQCRFLHEVPQKTRDVGFSSQNYEVRTVASGHVMDRRRRGFGQLEEVRSTVQTIVARSDIPKPVSCKTRLCYLWQTTGHCPYGELCRFAHGEAELQKLESCSASERGSIGCASATATTSAAAASGLRDSREIETDCENEGPRMKQFFKSKENKKLIDIYADWLEN